MACSLPYSGGQGDNNNGAGEETSERGKKNYAKNLMPVNVRALLQHQEPGEPLVMHGQVVGMVSLVGQVRQMSQGPVSLSYLLEDDTGRIEAIHYFDEDEEIQAPIMNTFVKIIGILKSGQDRNMVTVYRMLPVRDMHQVTAHKMEIIVTPLRVTKQQETASMAALATLKGFHPGFGFGSDGRGGSVNNNSQLLGSSHFPQQLQKQKSNNFDCFQLPRDPDTMRVLTSIKNCPVAIGLSMSDLLRYNRNSISESKMRDIIELLTSEGQIYLTVDDNHFKATDA